MTRAANPESAAVIPPPRDPPRPTEEHLSSCDWCWSFWDHTLEAERWSPTGERPRVVGDGPSCPLCQGTTYQLRRYTRGTARRRLEIAICFGCGHVRGLTQGAASTSAGEPSSADAGEPEASDTGESLVPPGETDAARTVPRFLRYQGPSHPGAAHSNDPDQETVFAGLRTLEAWEVGLFLGTIIISLLIWNIFIWVHGGGPFR